MAQYKFVVAEEYDEITVRSYLKNAEQFSTALIKKVRDTENGITVNGQAIRTIDKLKSGDELVVTLPAERNNLLPSAIEVPVVFEDSEVIVFNKPPEMPTHPSAQHYENTLANVFVGHLQKKGESGIFRPINRLDRNTSGLVVAAKTLYSASWLQKYLQKTYSAVIHGHLQEKAGTINLPIARKAGSIIEREVSEQGERAVTHFEVKKEFGAYTLVDIHLETGRTHQIRVHFSHIGHPLLGDDLYGGNHNVLKRQALHCSAVRFIHPIHRKMYIFESELGQDIQNALKSGL